MKQLSEENKEWLDKNKMVVNGCFSHLFRIDAVQCKLLEDQQRIDELEKEKYESIEAWNSKLEKLTTENAELKQLIAIDRVLTCGPLFEVCKESLAQHDKEVAVKAIEMFVSTLIFGGDIELQATFYIGDSNGAETLSDYCKDYLEQLQEQE